MFSAALTLTLTLTLNPNHIALTLTTLVPRPTRQCGQVRALAPGPVGVRGRVGVRVSVQALARFEMNKINKQQN